jgi:hypothetical protein
MKNKPIGQDASI